MATNTVYVHVWVRILFEQNVRLLFFFCQFKTIFGCCLIEAYLTTYCFSYTNAYQIYKVNVRHLDIKVYLNVLSCVFQIEASKFILILLFFCMPTWLQKICMHVFFKLFYIINGIQIFFSIFARYCLFLLNIVTKKVGGSKNKFFKKWVVK